MNDFQEIEKLLGSGVCESHLKNVDCYVFRDFGLFIQSTGFCQIATRPKHVHPSYMIIIQFGNGNYIEKPEFELKKNHYLASVLSPGIPHEDKATSFPDYYTIMIGQEFFEGEFALYGQPLEVFKGKQFQICHDVLKILHLFAFESSKNMQNSEITLECQAKLLTHWIIRSIIGENNDMRTVSSNGRIARVQTFTELHCGENLSVQDLADSAGMSVSNFNRIFRKECGCSPKQYLLEVRMTKATKLLRRNDFSVSEIAFKLGFSSAAHFSSAFHDYFSMTPSDYREKYQNLK